MGFDVRRLTPHRSTLVVVLAASVAAQNTAAPRAVFAVAVALWLAYVKVQTFAARASPAAAAGADARAPAQRDSAAEATAGAPAAHPQSPEKNKLRALEREGKAFGETKRRAPTAPGGGAAPA